MLDDERTHVVVPAMPGWFIIELLVDKDGNPDRLQELPIIAWQIVTGYDEGGNVCVYAPTPIMSFGSLPAHCNLYVIKTPARGYIDYNGEVFGDEHTDGIDIMVALEERCRKGKAKIHKYEQ